MNDKYLWDKSGEPDEEIQHLESLLSEFRYQPRPLVLPEATPKRMIFSYPTIRFAAIAATVLLALSLGLWLELRPAKEHQEQATKSVMTTPTPKANEKQEASVEQRVKPEVDTTQVVKQTRSPKPSLRAVKFHKQSTNKRLEAEGELAKEKVLYALQITSKQLDLISKKIQTDTN